MESDERRRIVVLINDDGTLEIGASPFYPTEVPLILREAAIMMERIELNMKMEAMKAQQEPSTRPKILVPEMRMG